MKLGILGAGAIARVMSDTVRKMQASGHKEVELYAVAARDLDRAQAFADKEGVARAYGSYEALLEDPAVDFVYIATPHSHHYRHLKLCIDHGKAVLCEKPFTVTARQAEDVFRYAREKGVLVTEAIWTRYQPMRRMITAALNSGVIGTPKLITANLGYPMLHKPRIVDPALAGGALLDVGIYALNFADMFFGAPDSVQGFCTKYETGVDLNDSVTLTWEDGRAAHLTSSANSVTDRQGAIYGDKGFLLVTNINNPQQFRIVDGDYKVIQSVDCPPQLTGYEYEVLEMADSLNKGLLECPSMPHRDTLRLMQIMDELRAQMGIRYPCEGVDDDATL